VTPVIVILRVEVVVRADAGTVATALEPGAPALPSLPEQAASAKSAEATAPRRLKRYAADLRWPMSNPLSHFFFSIELRSFSRERCT
jgi:hypothetical protein